MMQGNGETSDNGNLFTAYYVWGLVANKQLTDNEKERLINVYKNNFKQPGLLTRYPGSPDFEAQDDHFGLMAAEALLSPNDRPFTNAIYQYGENAPCNGPDPREPDVNTRKYNMMLYVALKVLFWRIKWNFNAVAPNSLSIYSWLGRFMNFNATIQMSARKFVNPIYWLYWAITMLQSVIWSPTTKNLDGYTLRTMSALSCQGYGPLTNLVCKLMRWRVKKDFGDFGKLAGTYFQNMNHPIVELLKAIY